MHHDIEVLKDLVKEGYSPREGANCIKGQLNIEGAKISYSPREGANCIEKEFIIKMTLLLLQSP